MGKEDGQRLLNSLVRIMAGEWLQLVAEIFYIHPIEERLKNSGRQNALSCLGSERLCLLPGLDKGFLFFDR